MNPEIKAKWVAALRSGEFTQGHGGLYNRETDSYCCLGVLCELAARENVVNHVRGEQPAHAVMNPTSREFDFFGDHEVVFGDNPTANSFVLPVQVQEWAGLAYPIGGYVPWEDDVTGLDYANDNGGTFEVIADLIEEYL